MCIICNCKSGTDFLEAFSRVSSDIEITINLIKKCSDEAENKNVSKQYDTLRRKMIRFKKDWNRLEENRP